MGGIVDSYSVLNLLSDLVDKSLVQTDDLSLETRYRLLETIRHYARNRLLEAGETDDVRSRHLAWFFSLAQRAEPELGAAGGPPWMDRLDVEHENLQSALEWAEITGDHETVLRLVAAISLFWEARGHRHQGIGGRWFARALAVDHGPSVARARALWAAAHMGIYGGDVAVTLARTPEALAVAEAVGDDRTMARAANTMNYARALFAPQEGLAGLTDSIELARSIGDEWAVADGLKMMTIAWASQGDYDSGFDAARELFEVAQRLGNKFFQAWAFVGTAYTAVRWGDFAAARDQLETALALCDEVGDPITRWMAICYLGEVDAMTGDYSSARARFEQVLHKGVASEGDTARHAAIPDLGSLMLDLGDVAGAAAVVEPWVADFEREVPLLRIPFLFVRGRLLVASDNEAGALSAFDTAKEVAMQIDNAPLAAEADYLLGQLARRQGEPADAEDLHHRALARRHQHRLAPGVAESLEALAGIAAGQESPTEAARVFGAAAAMRASLGFVRGPVDQSRYEEDVATARQRLDEDAFAKAWAEGEALTIDAIVAYATRARGERKRPSSGWTSLTPTELEVVKLVAKGLSNPEIAERLFISRATVKTHLAHVFAKLGVTGRAELASEATRRGLKGLHLA